MKNQQLTQDGYCSWSTLYRLAPELLQHQARTDMYPQTQYQG